MAYRRGYLDDGRRSGFRPRDSDGHDSGPERQATVKEFGGRWKFSKKRGVWIWKWKYRKVKKPKPPHES